MHIKPVENRQNWNYKYILLKRNQTPDGWTDTIFRNRNYLVGRYNSWSIKDDSVWGLCKIGSRHHFYSQPRNFPPYALSLEIEAVCGCQLVLGFILDRWWCYYCAPTVFWNLDSFSLSVWFSGVIFGCCNCWMFLWGIVVALKL